MSYYAIPLADHGFVPRDPETNSVRWYVENTAEPWRLLGPYPDMRSADRNAHRLNISTGRDGRLFEHQPDEGD